MNKSIFDNKWKFISGTTELEKISEYLNQMTKKNGVIVVNTMIDTVNKTVDYLIAIKANGKPVYADFSLPEYGEDGLH